MLKVVSLIASLTVISKILGLIRDLVIAHYFGTSMMADAFNLAYLFTGNVFIIFGGIGGPFYSAVVAKLPKLQDTPHIAWEFIKHIIIKASLALFLVSAGLYFFKSYLLKFFVDYAEKPEYFNLTLLNIDILLPLVLICGPIGIIFAILNCYKKYVEPSLSPAVVNVALIATVFLMGDSMSGLALAIGTSVGGILSLGFQFPSLIRIKSKIGTLKASAEDILKPKSDYYHILYPALLSTGMAQLMVFVDGFFCKGLAEGSWTSLVLANRLIQMPLGVLLTAFLVPLYPRITALIGDDNLAEVKRLLIKALKILSAIIIPGIIIGSFFAEDLIRLVFERGAFDARSTMMVSSVFFYISFSALPFVFRDSFTRTLYSFGDSKTPLYVMIAGIILKVILNFFLVERMGLEGIALSTTLVSLFNASVLFGFVRRKLS